MTKEELKEEEKTSEPEAPQAKEEESSEEKKSESAEGGQKEIDYEAELKKLQEERDNYKEGMLTYKSKLKDRQEEEEEEEEPKENIDEKLSEFKADIVKDNIEAILDTLTSNQSERKLIKWHYDNSIKHSGYNRSSIRKDLETAQAIANKDKIVIEKEELERSMDSNYSNSGYGSSVNKKVVNKNRELTPQELATFARINQRRKVNKRIELTREEFIKMLESNK